MSPLHWQVGRRRWRVVGPTPYALALAKAGLHPDNPDQMYQQLMLYIANPKAFKDRDPNWPGARDNLAWWEEPKGTATLNWPFHGGKWYDAAPKNDAQIRAVFKVPDKVPTKDWLVRVWHFPPTLAYRFRWETVNSGFDLLKTAGSIVDAAGKLLRQIPGVTDALKLQVDLDFAALGILVNTFVPSPGSDILHGFMGVAQDMVKRAIDNLGPKSAPEIVDAILKELHFLGDADILVRYLAEKLLTAQRFDAAFFNGLLNFDVAPGATDHEKALAAGAKDVWVTSLDPSLRRIIPPLVRLVVRLALTGKVVKSDLLAMLGMSPNPAIDKILDLFGIRDSAAPAPPAPAPAPRVIVPRPPPAAPVATVAPARPKILPLRIPIVAPPPGAGVVVQPAPGAAPVVVPPPPAAPSLLVQMAPQAAPQWICRMADYSHECGWV